MQAVNRSTCGSRSAVRFEPTKGLVSKTNQSLQPSRLPSDCCLWMMAGFGCRKSCRCIYSGCLQSAFCCGSRARRSCCCRTLWAIRSVGAGRRAACFAFCCSAGSTNTAALLGFHWLKYCCCQIFIYFSTPLMTWALMDPSPSPDPDAREDQYFLKMICMYVDPRGSVHVHIIHTSLLIL